MQMRKLQEMGGATLLVSLPKDWAKLASLKKGSLVSLEASSDGGLMIYPVREAIEGRQEKEFTIIYPSKYSGDNLANEITGAYLYGFDLIRIKGDRRISIEDREKIVSSIKLLIGLVVVEEDAMSITSQFLVDNTAVEPSKIFRRISAIVRAMISDTLKQLTSGDVTKFESVAQRDDEVDRLHFLLVRLIRYSNPRTPCRGKVWTVFDRLPRLSCRCKFSRNCRGLCDGAFELRVRDGYFGQEIACDRYGNQRLS